MFDTSKGLYVYIFTLHRRRKEREEDGLRRLSKVLLFPYPCSDFFESALDCLIFFYDSLFFIIWKEFSIK